MTGGSLVSAPLPCRRRPVRLGGFHSLPLILASSLLAWAGRPPEASAQFAPLCERNGRRDYCAVTIEPSRGDGVEVWTVVFADLSRYRLLRYSRRCRQQAPQERCEAAIEGVPGRRGPLSAEYRALRHEGGVSHVYAGAGLRILIPVLD